MKLDNQIIWIVPALLPDKHKQNQMIICLYKDDIKMFILYFTSYNKVYNF